MVLLNIYDTWCRGLTQKLQTTVSQFGARNVERALFVVSSLAKVKVRRQAHNLGACETVKGLLSE